MKFLLPAILLGVVAVSGCSHGAMRGSVAMKVDDQNAHVCLGEGEVKAGDRVRLYRNDCSGVGGRVGSKTSCEKVSLGEGTVTQALNEHYSLVKVDPGVQFAEGTTVEKVQ